MLQLYRFRYSTNVDRVALALAHKGVRVASVEIDPADDHPRVAAWIGRVGERPRS